MTSSRNIFVDTSALIALADKDDIYHKKAAAAYHSLLKSYSNIVTSNLVIAETYVLILNELGTNRTTATISCCEGHTQNDKRSLSLFYLFCQ